ncbi:MAG: triose-phosphate isomerase [Patescibacteria group bacterium]|nr:triose-phosphate isomerase [Patescibacteria group bacterium]
MVKKIVVANWKMNPTTFREAKAIFSNTKKQLKKTKGGEIIVCPPAVYISELKKISVGSKISLGSQNCFSEEKGPWTGEISPEMLKTSGAKFVILGHSENRKTGDSDELINRKVKLALKSGLNVILCVGELERDEDGHYFRFLKKQILDDLEGVSKNYLKNTLIAYEPVWAVGVKAKETITKKQLQEATIFIKKVLVDKYNVRDFKDVKILYGGSVNYKITEELRETDVDGFLVGRDSLNKEKFNKFLEVLSGV